MSVSKPRMMLRAAAYGAYGGDRIGGLHHATKISLTTSISGVPTLKLTHTEEPNPALEAENEIAVEVSYDGGLTWTEPPGGSSFARRRGTSCLMEPSPAPSTACTSARG